MSQTCQRCYRIVDRAYQSETEWADCKHLRQDAVDMLPDPHKGQWWNDANPRLAYYMTLRVHYEMPALEAWQYMKHVDRKYPGMLSNFMGHLRTAIQTMRRRAEMVSD